MTSVLIATDSGCTILNEAGQQKIEFAGRSINALALEPEQACVAVLDGREIWRRYATGEWLKLAVVEIALQSIFSSRGTIFCGGMDEATIFRIDSDNIPERLESFDETSGRSEWFAGGPPLGVRSFTETVDGNSLLAAVHVGGVPHSDDGGATWKPTMPVMFDVHEVRAHPSLPNVVAAATALGLCISNDWGKHWELIDDTAEPRNSLAVAVLQNEILFSVQDGPFAKQSRVRRFDLIRRELSTVREGLPDWFCGKVDTNQIAVGEGRAAIADGGGNVWLSESESREWKCIATNQPYACGLVILDDLQGRDR